MIVKCKSCGRRRKPAFFGSRHCSACRNDARRAAYAASPDSAKKRSALYRKQNPAKVRTALKAWREKHPEKARENLQRWRVRNRVRNSLANIKHRAKRAGMPFDLKPSDIVIPERCPVFGLKLRIGCGARSDASPSIDRLIPKRGYVRGNVRVISDLANRIKNTGTPRQHRLVADWLERELRKANRR